MVWRYPSIHHIFHSCSSDLLGLLTASLIHNFHNSDLLKDKCYSKNGRHVISRVKLYWFPPLSFHCHVVLTSWNVFCSYANYENIMLFCHDYLILHYQLLSRVYFIVRSFKQWINRDLLRQLHTNVWIQHAQNCIWRAEGIFGVIALSCFFTTILCSAYL